MTATGSATSGRTQADEAYRARRAHHDGCHTKHAGPDSDGDTGQNHKQCRRTRGNHQAHP